MEEKRIDPRQTTPEEKTEGMRQTQVLFRVNHTMPYTDEFNALQRELFGGNPAKFIQEIHINPNTIEK